MIIKKYKAKTEQEATLLAKEDLGPEAIVMNVKTIKAGGFFGLFKKSRVELTAAIDDVVEKTSLQTETKEDTSLPKAEEPYRFGNAFSAKKDSYSEDTQNAIEDKINSIAKLLEQQLKTDKPIRQDISDETEDINRAKNVPAEDMPKQKSKSKVVDLIYQQLIDNEVSVKYADMLVDELESGVSSIDNTLANAYQKIVLKLGEIHPLVGGENKPKVIFFVGNTGVGKTTTMAKLASKCMLEDKLSVAMLSVDTYRIAAIEQIKTYANILNAPMSVVYTPEDMKQSVEKYKNYDLILVDTAGRSHKNEEHRADLMAIIDSVTDVEMEIYLVVSATTKYSDLYDIASTYQKLFDYRIIFTKLDETTGVGSILNLKLDTGKDLSYVTWGQNVPEDIGLVNSQVIAKKLLGGAR